MACVNCNTAPSYPISSTHIEIKEHIMNPAEIVEFLMHTYEANQGQSIGEFLESLRHQEDVKVASLYSAYRWQVELIAKQGKLHLGEV